MSRPGIGVAGPDVEDDLAGGVVTQRLAEVVCGAAEIGSQRRKPRYGVKGVGLASAIAKGQRNS